jgi:hypothetical protein
MPANKLNYIVLFKGDSQVYGSTTKERALETPPPEGVPIEDKRVFFITLMPDDGKLVVHQLPDDEVFKAPLKIKGK